MILILAKKQRTPTTEAQRRSLRYNDYCPDWDSSSATKYFSPFLRFSLQNLLVETMIESFSDHCGNL